MRALVVVLAVVLGGCGLWLEGGGPTEVEDPVFPTPAAAEFALDTVWVGDTIVVVVRNPNGEGG